MSRLSQQGVGVLFLAPPTPNHKPLPSSGKAGRNLPAAVASALILLAALGIALVFSRPVFIGFVAVLALVACWEIAGAFARKGITVMLPALYVGTIGMLVTGVLLGAFWVMAWLYFTFALIVISRLAFTSLKTPAALDVAVSAFTAVYIPFAASFVALTAEESANPWTIVFFVVIVACNDLGGWIAGVLFGKHPMTPKLSPKKSWEGFAGSIIMCIVAGIISTFVLAIPWWWGPIFGVSAAILGTIGDLTESLIKREVGLKDMSSIVPGHGGLMDRLDSMLFAAPAFYFFFAISMHWWAA